MNYKCHRIAIKMHFSPRLRFRQKVRLASEPSPKAENAILELASSLSTLKSRDFEVKFELM